jgi:hypothetical protein
MRWAYPERLDATRMNRTVRVEVLLDPDGRVITAV